MASKLWRYFLSELEPLELPFIQTDNVKNFLTVPSRLERAMVFAMLCCFHSILALFTFAPLRILICAFNLLFLRKPLTVYQRVDLLKFALVMTTIALLIFMDASRLYHLIRGQAVIKLYVIFNVLEIGNRLCTSFGQDILAIYLTQPSFTHFLLSSSYIVLHTLILYVTVVTLNVSINSHNNALLTLLVSNQFIEIKGSVFKKYDTPNIFKIWSRDVCERVQVIIFLCIIAMWNCAQVDFESIALMQLLSRSQQSPQMYSRISAILGTVVYPILVIYLSEIIVDWLKHAFITKFNQIPPSIYTEFLNLLCQEMVAPSDARVQRDDEVKGDRKMNQYSDKVSVSMVDRTEKVNVNFSFYWLAVLLTGLMAAFFFNCCIGLYLIERAHENNSRHRPLATEDSPISSETLRIILGTPIRIRKHTVHSQSLPNSTVNVSFQELNSFDSQVDIFSHDILPNSSESLESDFTTLQRSLFNFNENDSPKQSPKAFSAPATPIESELIGATENSD